MTTLAFSMHDDERQRLLGVDGSGPRRRARDDLGGGTSIGPLVLVVLGVMVAVTFVYCVVMVRSPEKSAGALQGLLAVVPLGTLVLTLRKDRNGD